MTPRLFASVDAGLSVEEERPPRRRGRWWLRLAVSGLVLAWLISQTSWQPLADLFVGMKPAWWLSAVLVYAVAQVVSSKRWQLLAHALGFAAPLSRYLSLYYLGMFFSLFLPTSIGGDVVRAWVLAEQPRRRGAALLSVVSERFSGLIALVILAFLAALVQYDTLPWWVLASVLGLTVGMVGGLTLLPIGKRYSIKLKSLAQALSLSRQHRGRWWVALGLAFLVQLGSIVQIALVGHALGLSVPLLGYAVAVPLVSLLTMLPLSLNGLGIREGSLILLLAPFGVTVPGAVALGLAWFALTLTLGLMGGVVYLFQGFSSWSPPEQDAHATLSGDSDQGRMREPAAAA